MKEISAAIAVAILVGAVFAFEYWRCSSMFPNAVAACMLSNK